MAGFRLALKRGTDEQRRATILAEGEPCWTTDLHELWIGDGETAGGIKVEGVDGATGPSGPAGPQGPAGPAGPTGPQGATGEPDLALVARSPAGGAVLDTDSGSLVWDVDNMQQVLAL